MLGNIHSYLWLHVTICSLWTTGHTNPIESSHCWQEVVIPLAQIPCGSLLTTPLYMNMQLWVWFSFIHLFFPCAMIVRNSLLGLEFLLSLINEISVFSLTQGGKESKIMDIYLWITSRRQACFLQEWSTNYLLFNGVFDFYRGMSASLALQDHLHLLGN